MRVERVLLLVTVWRFMDKGGFLEGFLANTPGYDQTLTKVHRTLLLSSYSLETFSGLKGSA